MSKPIVGLDGFYMENAKEKLLERRVVLSR